LNHAAKAKLDSEILPAAKAVGNIFLISIKKSPLQSN